MVASCCWMCLKQAVLSLLAMWGFVSGPGHFRTEYDVEGGLLEASDTWQSISKSKSRVGSAPAHDS